MLLEIQDVFIKEMLQQTGIIGIMHLLSCVSRKKDEGRRHRRSIVGVREAERKNECRMKTYLYI